MLVRADGKSGGIRVNLLTTVCGSSSSSNRKARLPMGQEGLSLVLIVEITCLMS